MSFLFHWLLLLLSGDLLEVDASLSYVLLSCSRQRSAITRSHDCFFVMVVELVFGTFGIWLGFYESHGVARIRPFAVRPFCGYECSPDRTTVLLFLLACPR